MNYLVDLNLNNNQLKNVILDSVSSIPSTNTAEKGRLLFNTSTNRPGWSDGTNWLWAADAGTTTRLDTEISNIKKSLENGGTIWGKIEKKQDKLTAAAGSGITITGTHNDDIADNISIKRDPSLQNILSVSDAGLNVPNITVTSKTEAALDEYFVSDIIQSTSVKNQIQIKKSSLPVAKVSAIGLPPITVDTNTTNGTKFTVSASIATDKFLGVVKGSTLQDNTKKTYGVQVDPTGVMTVNVPWTDTNTDTKYSAGKGLTLSGTVFNVNALSTTLPVPASVTTVSGREYPIAISSDNKLSVNVPWTDTNTTYSAGDGLTLTGTQFKTTLLDYVKSTGIAKKGGGDVSSRLYAVELDKDGKLAVGVPWTNTDTKYYIKKTAGTADTPYSARYELVAGSGTNSPIEIAKDMVVTSGVVRKATTDDKTKYPNAGLVVGDEYIVLTLAASTEPVFIPAKSLVDSYTSGDTYI